VDLIPGDQVLKEAAEGLTIMNASGK